MLGKPRKNHFMFFYRYWSKDASNGVGHCSVTIRRPTPAASDIAELEELIAEGNGFDKIVCTGFTPLRGPR